MTSRTISNAKILAKRKLLSRLQRSRRLLTRNDSLPKKREKEKKKKKKKKKEERQRKKRRHRQQDSIRNKR